MHASQTLVSNYATQFCAFVSDKTALQKSLSLFSMLIKIMALIIILINVVNSREWTSNVQSSSDRTHTVPMRALTRHIISFTACRIELTDCDKKHENLRSKTATRQKTDVHSHICNANEYASNIFRQFKKTYFYD